MLASRLICVALALYSAKTCMHVLYIHTSVPPYLQLCMYVEYMQ